MIIPLFSFFPLAFFLFFFFIYMSNQFVLVLLTADLSIHLSLFLPLLTKRLPTSVRDIVNNSPFLAPDGTLFIGSKDTHIFALNPDNREVATVFSSKGIHSGGVNLSFLLTYFYLFALKDHRSICLNFRAKINAKHPQHLKRCL